MMEGESTDTLCWATSRSLGTLPFWGGGLVLGICFCLLTFTCGLADAPPLSSGSVPAGHTSVPSPVPASIEHSLEGRRPSGSWELGLFWAGDSAEAVRRAKYVHLLCSRFAAHDLEVLGIVAEDRQDLWHSLAKEGFGYPIYYDEDGRIAATLDTTPGEDRVWLVDPHGAIRFEGAGRVIQDQDLRLLLEKHLKRAISYFDDETQRPLRPGDPFPPLRVRSTLSGDLVALPPENREAFEEYAIFTAECVQCSLQSQLELYAEYEATRANSGVKAVLFSSRFSLGEVRDLAPAYNIRSPIFIAESEIPGIEDLYFLESYGLADALLVELDADGMVSRIATLPEVLAESSTSPGEL